ncbi:MAG TPA: hypothetical protein VFQ28_06690 [Gaiella sp.]|nr:hypothetical protein [Gaiella sp.]
MSNPVCILSVGRSGSSLAARAINLLGIDLGPEESLLPVTDMNPSGSWEQHDMVYLNGEILTALGGSYLEPPPREPGWENGPEVAPLRARAEALVAELFDGRDRWGFKSPLAILTLPLWQPAMGDLDYVICVRNPLEFVESAKLWVPDVRPLDPAALWLYLNCEALRMTAGGRRTFVFYEDWFRDSRAVVGDLASFLHGPEAEVPAAVEEEIAALVNPALRRQRADALDLARRADLTVEARTFHFLVRALADAEREGDDRAPALHSLTASLDGGAVVRSPHRG